MMKGLIIKAIDKYVSGVFVEAKPYKSFIDIKSLPPSYYKSFGTKNPNKTFYVIWLDHRGSGFFSNFSSALCHLKIAKDAGMIPIIDFQNFPTLYNEDSRIGGTSNSWEYYFHSVSPYKLNEVYQSKNVVFASGRYPRGMSYSITEIQGLYKIYKQYIAIQQDIQKQIDTYTKEIGFTEPILGVHFRGQEQKYATGHSFPPTVKQMLRYTDEILEKYKMQKLFIVTEDKRYLSSFIKRYGDIVRYTNSFRTDDVNAYKIHPRDNHMYLMGKEVLIDTMLLAKCEGLLCGDSNVSETAKFVNNGRYKFVYQIDNGVNVDNPLVARHLYAVKKLFPKPLGGLKDSVNIIYNVK